MGEGAAVGRGSVGLRKERSPSAVVHQSWVVGVSEKVGGMHDQPSNGTSH